MCWSHIRWVLFQRRASHRLLLYALGETELQSHGCGRWQDEDGSQSKHAGLSRSSQQVGHHPYPERCQGPGRASWCCDSGALPDPLDSYSLLTCSMTKPGCPILAGNYYWEDPAHWPDLAGAPSLPWDGDKMQRWSEGLLRGDSLPRVTVGEVKPGLEP